MFGVCTLLTCASECRLKPGVGCRGIVGADCAGHYSSSHATCVCVFFCLQVLVSQLVLAFWPVLLLSLLLSGETGLLLCQPQTVALLHKSTSQSKWVTRFLRLLAPETFQSSGNLITRPADLDQPETPTHIWVTGSRETGSLLRIGVPIRAT